LPASIREIANYRPGKITEGRLLVLDGSIAGTDRAAIIDGPNAMPLQFER